jgi:hypothetical protein
MDVPILNSVHINIYCRNPSLQVKYRLVVLFLLVNFTAKKAGCPDFGMFILAVLLLNFILPLILGPKILHLVVFGPVQE